MPLDGAREAAVLTALDPAAESSVGVSAAVVRDGSQREFDFRISLCYLIYQWIMEFTFPCRRA